MPIRGKAMTIFVLTALFFPSLGISRELCRAASEKDQSVSPANLQPGTYSGFVSHSDGLGFTLRIEVTTNAIVGTNADDGSFRFNYRRCSNGTVQNVETLRTAYNAGSGALIDSSGSSAFGITDIFKFSQGSIGYESIVTFERTPEKNYTLFKGTLEKSN